MPYVRVRVAKEDASKDYRAGAIVICESADVAKSVLPKSAIIGEMTPDALIAGSVVVMRDAAGAGPLDALEDGADTAHDPVEDHVEQDDEKTLEPADEEPKPKRARRSRKG